MWGDREWPRDRLESKPALLLSGSVGFGFVNLKKKWR